jgi:hypothetical protein
VRVYLSDDFRRPVETRGLQGRAEVRQGKGTPVAAAFQADPGGRFLSAKVASLSAEPAEVTARLVLGELGPKYGVPNATNEDFFMTFVVDPQETTGEPRTRTLVREVLDAGTPRPAAKVIAGEVRIDVQGGYKPDLIVLRRGVTTRLRFNRRDTGECSRELLIPELGVKTELAPLGETVVEVTPDKAGTYAFHCGMNMLKGTLRVE